jgi:hypothetical protein
MSRDVTLSGKGATLAPLPAVSPEIRRILDATVGATAFGGDAGEEPGVGPWREPKWLPEPLRAEAEKVLPPHEFWAAPATPTFIRDFLLLLFGATRHNADQDWDVISQTYPLMLGGWPAWCFHPDFIPETGQHFKWFPSVAELADWLRPRRVWIENEAYRLRVLSKLPTQPKAKRLAAEPEREEPWRPATPEEKAQATENLRAYRERPPTPFHASLRPEDDHKGFKPIASTKPPIQVSGVPGREQSAQVAPKGAAAAENPEKTTQEAAG